MSGSDEVVGGTSSGMEPTWKADILNITKVKADFDLQWRMAMGVWQRFFDQLPCFFSKIAFFAESTPVNWLAT